jgi:cytochrome c-type biogenesis protein CcmF
MVKGYEVEKDVRMAVGDTVAIGGHVVRFAGVREAAGPNYRAQVGTVELLRDGELRRTLAPEKRLYFSSQMPMTETAIDSTLWRHIYVSLGERLSAPGEPEVWSVRVYYKPFVVWIWGGFLLMAIGGAFAVADRRYRARRTAPAPLANPA